MVTLSEEALARFVINRARERMDWGNVDDAPPVHGKDTSEWTLADLDPSCVDVDTTDDMIVVTGIVEAAWSEQVRKATRYPNSKAHPAEYENNYFQLEVSIELSLDDEYAVPRVHAYPA